MVGTTIETQPYECARGEVLFWRFSTASRLRAKPNKPRAALSCGHRCQNHKVLLRSTLWPYANQHNHYFLRLLQIGHEDGDKYTGHLRERDVLGGFRRPRQGGVREDGRLRQRFGPVRQESGQFSPPVRVDPEMKGESFETAHFTHHTHFTTVCRALSTSFL